MCPLIQQPQQIISRLGNVCCLSCCPSVIAFTYLVLQLFAKGPRLLHITTSLLHSVAYFHRLILSGGTTGSQFKSFPKILFTHGTSYSSTKSVGIVPYHLQFQIIMSQTINKNPVNWVSTTGKPPGCPAKASSAKANSRSANNCTFHWELA